MKFEWDENKEKINIIKYKVSFTEATEVFYDYFAVIFDDTELSYNATGARYGYNGTHEQDLEVNLDGNYLSFGDFGYDTRVAQRFNLDPIDHILFIQNFVRSIKIKNP